MQAKLTLVGIDDGAEWVEPNRKFKIYLFYLCFNREAREYAVKLARKGVTAEADLFVDFKTRNRLLKPFLTMSSHYRRKTKHLHWICMRIGDDEKYTFDEFETLFAFDEGHALRKKIQSTAESLVPVFALLAAGQAGV